MNNFKAANRVDDSRVPNVNTYALFLKEITKDSIRSFVKLSADLHASHKQSVGTGWSTLNDLVVSW